MQIHNSMKVGGIVLCGGQSRRMGVPKATLPFGSELMLHRVLRLLGQVVQPLVVVAAPAQQLPPLPPQLLVARDRRPGRGPLEGLYAGLQTIQPHADAAFATSCDVPLLVPDFVREMIQHLGDYQIAVPDDGKRPHPLAAVYRVTVLPAIAALLDAGRLRPAYLFDELPTRRVAVEQLRKVDPQLQTLANLNEPQDYFAALASCGLEAPPDILRQLDAGPD